MSAPRRLPSKVQLPSGRVVAVVAEKGIAARPPSPGAPFFAEAIALFDSGGVTLSADGADVDVHTLELRDFHALRAIVTSVGLLPEEPVEFACKNCQATIVHGASAALPLGPFADRELHDPDLDTTLDLAIAHEIPLISLGRVREARTLMLSPLTVEDAQPLFAALARDVLHITSDVARGMGILALGDERSLPRIARALTLCSDEAWTAVTDLYVAAHYPARLFSIALCTACGARHDVDAPYDREFEPGEGASGVRGAENSPADPALAPIPAFDAFADRARQIATGTFETEGVEDVSFVVEDGVPAVDDGGEPLLGAYVPGYSGDMGSPSRSSEITVYFRTFRAIWNEEGPYDWDAELVETIEHELEHHLADLAGGDPVDDAERLEIREEAERILGKRAIARDAVRFLGSDLTEFARRTWPIWLLVILTVVGITIYGK